MASRSLTGDPGWNANLVSDDLAAAIGKLKGSVTGGDIYSFGGAGLAKSLMSLGLVDEYYLMVTPQFPGRGMRLFDGDPPAVALELKQARPLDVGAVILHYHSK